MMRQAASRQSKAVATACSWGRQGGAKGLVGLRSTLESDPLGNRDLFLDSGILRACYRAGVPGYSCGGWDWRGELGRVGSLKGARVG